MTSALCTVNGNVPTNGIDVASGAVVTIALADVSGVDLWDIRCIGTDEGQSASAITAGITVNVLNKTATLTMPTDPCSLVFQSKVNNGVDVINRIPQAEYTKTFKVCVLTTQGDRLLAFGEQYENDASYGWTPIVNRLVRRSTSTGGGTGVTPPSGGNNSYASVSNLNIVPIQLFVAPVFVGDWVVAGAIAFDASTYPASLNNLSRYVSLETVLESASGTCEARLYNVTDSEAVTGALCTTTSATPVAVTSGEITVGTSTGQLKPSPKVYQLQVRRTAGTIGASVQCSYAAFSIGYVTLNASPTITSLSHPTRLTTDGSFTLTVYGTNFVSGSVVSVGGTPKTTVFVDNGTLTVANVGPFSAGSYNVIVTNPAPGGGTSNTVSIIVSAPPAATYPYISSISPSSRTTSDYSFDLYIYGTDFDATCVASFAGTPLSTTFLSSTQLRVALGGPLPASNYAIKVNKPAVGDSNTVYLSVVDISGGGGPPVYTYPVPYIVSVSPASVTQSGGNTTVTVTTTGCDASYSVFYVNGAPYSATYIGSNQFTLSLPSSPSRVDSITIFNPSPGGGTSNAATFTVTAPPTLPSFTVSLSTVSNWVKRATFSAAVSYANANGFIDVYGVWPNGGVGQLGTVLFDATQSPQATFVYDFTGQFAGVYGIYGVYRNGGTSYSDTRSNTYTIYVGAS